MKQILTERYADFRLRLREKAFDELDAGFAASNAGPTDRIKRENHSLVNGA